MRVHRLGGAMEVKSGRRAPRLNRKGQNREVLPVPPMNRALTALRASMGRDPSELERTAWIKAIEDIAWACKRAQEASRFSAGPAKCQEELEEIREAAKTIAARLDSLSRDAYHLLRFAGIPTNEDILRHRWRSDEEGWLRELSGEIDGPRDPDGVLSHRMKGLVKLASIALERIPTTPNGSRTIYEGTVGPPDLGLIGECCRRMALLTGGVKRLIPFARAIKELAFPGWEPPDNWGKDLLPTVEKWWGLFGPHADQILEAEMQWDGVLHDANETFWQGLARISGLPLETVRLYAGPYTLRGTPLK